MISHLISWSLHNRLLVLASAMILLLWGGWRSADTPVDVFPDLTAPAVTIVAEAHGMPPEDVERLVTFPIETAVNGAAGVRRVRSVTGVGNSVITVDFDWSMDIYQARQLIAERLQTVRSALPDDIPSPILAPVTSIMGEVMFIALVSDEHDEMTLKTVADWTLRRRLLAVAGVAQVIPIGGETRQYQVVADPERLSAYGVSLGDLRAAVGAASQNAYAGFVTQNGQEFLIQGLGRIRTIADIESGLVVTRGGVPVLVRDLADVRIGPAPRRGTGSYRARSAVVLSVQKQPDVNTLELTERIDGTIAELQASLPVGMRIETDAFRQAEFIDVAIRNLISALRDGAILVTLIMFIFLVSIRATIIALLAIPLSLVVAILSISWLGGSLNTMTLGGMAIALGALVDDAIIVVENTFRRLRQNRDKPTADRESTLRVALTATQETQRSIVFATLIIILVFLPLFFLSGVEGRLLHPLGVAYVMALGSSLLVAVTVTPVLCSLGLARDAKTKGTQDSRLVKVLKGLYRPMLERAIRHPGVLAGTAIVMLGAAGVGALAAGRGFLPEFNEGTLTLSVVSLPGTALETSDQIGRDVESILLTQPQIRATARRTGRAELDPHAQQVFASEIDATLNEIGNGKPALLANLRREFAALPGTNVVIGQPISHRIDHMLSGSRASIAVKVFGDDLSELRRLAKTIETLVSAIPGAVDVAAAEQAEIPFIQVEFDRAALSNFGITMLQAAEALETAFYGTTVDRVMEGDASFDLVVRLPEEASRSIESVQTTLLTLPGGALIPFESVAKIVQARGANSITRENVKRNIVVMANVSGRDVVSVVKDIQTLIADRVVLPSGYAIKYGGQFESAASAGARLLLLGSIVVVGVFLLLVAAFRSIRNASLVMLNLPLALIGGIAGVWVGNGTLTVASIIGCIALFGIATRNGVILIDHVTRLINSGGLKVGDAVRQGAEERLVPILMTAMATALALVPLALSEGMPGSEIQAPMALVILFGLLTSTALNMLVVPAMYLRFGERGSDAGLQ
ncbi:MAG: efflux RND transporter permease subunit [Pseudomonadota bacterium]